MKINYEDISELLHDGWLLHLDWDSSLAKLSLTYSCLRRDDDGSVLTAPVELSFQGIEKLAMYYAPSKIEVRPSEFHVPNPLSIEDLIHWKIGRCEASLSINSLCSAVKMETSCRIDWLLGEQQTTDPFDIIPVHLSLENYTYAGDSVTTSFFFLCSDIEIQSAGVPLELDEWASQFEAWWKGWNQHWKNKDSTTSNEIMYEDTFIPAGISTPDLSYRPPAKSPFSVTTDCPTSLLQPIKDFHVSHHEQDWLTFARSYPDLDETLEQRAEQLQEWYLSHLFGSWVFVRHVDSWWLEGRRACVVVRGMEHCMPDEEDPVSEIETIITYDLREWNGNWIIWSWSQGYT